MYSGIKIILYLILAFLAAGFTGWLISIFNSLVQVKNNINKAWKNIDVLLLQRNEELPKLVDIVKTYMQYEQDVLQSITTLRSGYQNAKSVLAKTNIENRMRERMGRLAAVAERYPDLKADELYQRAMERVSALEASIADRRVFFNDTVNIYNLRSEQFPQLIFAWIMRYKPHPYLKLPQEKRP